jgi:hypothetical protein
MVAAETNQADLTELLNPDDNFSEKKVRKAKKKDSIETSFVAFHDLNMDGSKDTAFLTYNNLSKQTSIRFTGMDGYITQEHSTAIRLKDIGDLNGDGKHEIMMTIQSESCWDEVKLLSHTGSWVEKYNGLAYQCIEDNSYQFNRIDDRTVKLVTFGVNRDSIDLELGDTLENILPNARIEHLITW